MKTFYTLLVLTVLAGCASPAVEPPASAITWDEAAAFEQTLLARAKGVPPLPAPVYVQPVNKTIPCKLPSSPEQMARSNFRAFWDGDCKNGFAFGMGRDIALSDTHHFEEITVHDGTGVNWHQPRVSYDYVNQQVSYAVGGAAFPEVAQFSEHYQSALGRFNVLYTLGATDAAGQVFAVHSQAFSPQRVYVHSRLDRAIAYRFSDQSVAPLVDINRISFVAEMIDPATERAGGVAIVRYAGGAVQHFKMLDGQALPATLPKAYTEHVLGKFHEVLNRTAQLTQALVPAQTLEREYLFKACEGSRSLPGLEQATYRKICTWREQFKAPYQAAALAYQRQLEGEQQQAAMVAAQRNAQEQRVLQQALIKQQQNQQFLNQLNQTNLQLQQSTQQFLQGVNSWQAPQVQPIAPLNTNSVTCFKNGSVMTCR